MPEPQRRDEPDGRMTVPWIAVVAALLAGLLVVPAGRWAWEKVALDPGRDGTTRVLFVGDSMMIGAARQMSQRFGRDGIETRFVGYPGTGLLSGQGWWNRELAHAVRTWRPDVVVLEACCNYLVREPGWILPDGTTIKSNSPAMFSQWESQAKEATALASAHGAHVFWVVTPAVDPELWPAYTPRIPRFNEIYDRTGADRIDWASIVTPDGTFTPTLQIDGKEVPIRDEDGLHLTLEGNGLIVEETYRQVAAVLG